MQTRLSRERMTSVTSSTCFIDIQFSTNKSIKVRVIDSEGPEILVTAINVILFGEQQCVEAMRHF